MEPCRYCRKPIIFVETERGRRMPCERDPVIATELAPVLNKEGQLVKTGTGYLPHWKQCTRPPKRRRA